MEGRAEETSMRVRVQVPCPVCKGTAVDPSGADCTWEQVREGERLFCDGGYVELWADVPEHMRGAIADTGAISFDPGQ